MPRRPLRPSVLWSAVLLALVAAHDATHLLDGGLETGPGQLALVSVPQWLVLAAVMTVIVRGGARGRQAAMLLRIGTTAGFALVHLLPFSAAPYWDLEPSAVSWLVAWVPAAVGLVVAAVAWAEGRRASRRQVPQKVRYAPKSGGAGAP